MIKMINNCSIKLDDGKELRIGDTFYGAVNPARFGGIELYDRACRYSYGELLKFKVVKLVLIEFMASTFYGHTFLPDPRRELDCRMRLATTDFDEYVMDAHCIPSEIGNELSYTEEEAKKYLMRAIKEETERRAR